MSGVVKRPAAAAGLPFTSHLTPATHTLLNDQEVTMHEGRDRKPLSLSPPLPPSLLLPPVTAAVAAALPPIGPTGNHRTATKMFLKTFRMNILRSFSGGCLAANFRSSFGVSLLSF